MVKRHQQEAAAKSRDRADELNGKGDVDGATTWLVIAERAAELLEPGGSA
jgi:hypothetical protein